MGGQSPLSPPPGIEATTSDGLCLCRATSWPTEAGSTSERGLRGCGVVVVVVVVVVVLVAVVVVMVCVCVQSRVLAYRSWLDV